MILKNKIINMVIVYILLLNIISGIQEIKNIDPNNSSTSINYKQKSDEEYILFKPSNQNQIHGLDYIIFELLISPSDMETIQKSIDVLPILCYEIDKDITLKYSKSSLDTTSCNGFDLNQYIRANGQYSLQIQINSLSFNELKILVYISGITVNVLYNFRAKYRKSQETVCPFNCFNKNLNRQGQCINNECTCPLNTVDYDCSQNAILITNLQTNLKVSSTQMTYMYYKPLSRINDLDDASDLVLSFSLVNSQPPVDIYVSIEGKYGFQQIIFPTEDYYLQKFTIEDGDNKITLRSSGQYSLDGVPISTVIGFKAQNYKSNQNENIIIVTISDAEEEESTNTNMIIIYFLVGVVSLLFLIWIILTIIKIRYQRRNQVVDLSLAQAQQNAALQRQQNRRGQSNKLTPELIDQFLPSSVFEKVKNKQQQKGKQLNDQCSVCLCEFEITDICRETICNHYFHKDCIEQWLKKQENCPFCRTELSRDSLVKHFEALKIQSDQPESNDNQQQNNDDQYINDRNQQQNPLSDQNGNNNALINGMQVQNNFNENYPLQNNNNTNPTNINFVSQRNLNINNQLIVQRNVSEQNSQIQNNQDMNYSSNQQQNIDQQQQHQLD